MSKAITKSCQLMGITHITTVPYRPQGNGVLERFHRTLKPLLAKAADNGFDWTEFIPLALSALRSIPCRSTGFSPSEIVFGRNPRNILDVGYEGWTNPTFKSTDIPTWVEQLQDKLEILTESAAFQNHLTKLKQKESKNRHRFTRKYKPGDLVFSRIPGCRATLQASWEGPFTIVKDVPLLNYEITDPSVVSVAA